MPLSNHEHELLFREICDHYDRIIDQDENGNPVFFSTKVCEELDSLDLSSVSYPEWGPRCAFLRKKARFTAQQVANILHVSPSSISKIEKPPKDEKSEESEESEKSEKSEKSKKSKAPNLFYWKVFCILYFAYPESFCSLYSPEKRNAIYFEKPNFPLYQNIVLNTVCQDRSPSKYKRVQTLINLGKVDFGQLLHTPNPVPPSILSNDDYKSIDFFLKKSELLHDTELRAWASDIRSLLSQKISSSTDQDVHSWEEIFSASHSQPEKSDLIMAEKSLGTDIDPNHHLTSTTLMGLISFWKNYEDNFLNDSSVSDLTNHLEVLNCSEVFSYNKIKVVNRYLNEQKLDPSVRAQINKIAFEGETIAWDMLCVLQQTLTDFKTGDLSSIMELKIYLNRKAFQNIFTCVCKMLDGGSPLEDQPFKILCDFLSFHHTFFQADANKLCSLVDQKRLSKEEKLTKMKSLISNKILITNNELQQYLMLLLEYLAPYPKDILNLRTLYEENQSLRKQITLIQKSTTDFSSFLSFLPGFSKFLEDRSSLYSYSYPSKEEADAWRKEFPKLLSPLKGDSDKWEHQKILNELFAVTDQLSANGCKTLEIMAQLSLADPEYIDLLASLMDYGELLQSEIKKNRFKIGPEYQCYLK